MSQEENKGVSMCMDNRLKFVGVIILGIVAGMTILYAVTLGVAMALKPLSEDMKVIASSQVKIEKALAAAPVATGGASGEAQLYTILLSRMNELEKQVSELKARGGAPAVPQPPAEDYNKVYDIPVGTTPVAGKADAPIMIVEFSDLQCPYCSRFHPAIQDVLKAYPDKVKVMFKHYPLGFHAMARPAAKATLAAGAQGKYYEMIDQILKDNSDLSEAKIEAAAKTIGLDMARFKKDWKDRDAEWEKVIEADIALGEQVEVPGTPSYYLNGKKSRARSLDQWKQEIDALLKK